MSEIYDEQKSFTGEENYDDTENTPMKSSMRRSSPSRSEAKRVTRGGNRSNTNLDQENSTRGGRERSSRRIKQQTRTQGSNKKNQEEENQKVRKNEFWKYRHNKNKEQKKQEEVQIKSIDQVQKYHFNHINMDNEEEVMKVSLIKAQEFNKRLLDKKVALKETFQQMERESVQRKEIDANRYSQFPSDIPLYLYDNKGNQYISDPNQLRDHKGTIEQFIYINVQHENNPMYLQELGRAGGYISKNVLKAKKKKRKKRNMNTPYQQLAQQNLNHPQF